MTPHHPDLAAGRWYELSLAEQLGNVGSEVSRALRGRKGGNRAREVSALERALELLDLTIRSPAHQGRRRELCRVREVLCDYFLGDNEYGSTPESLDRYFLAFAVLARRIKDRRLECRW